jgi:DNA-directed RNA polymerase I subunit RPA49
LKHYIAVVDPAKKTWQFVEVRKVTLRGTVRRLKVREEKEEEEEEEVVSFSFLYSIYEMCWKRRIK